MRYLIPLLSLVVFVGCQNGGSSRGYDSNRYTEDSRGFEDGVYSAIVDYHNSSTNYSSTYTLDVEVEDNQVTTIYFPRGGHLDGNDIYPGKLDKDGYVSIEGLGGKSYDIQIDY
jgi:hypothetical protein